MSNYLEEYLKKKQLVKCEACGGALVYTGLGQYKCRECEAIYLDDFGKVRQFLEENGPTPSIVISKVTGVEKNIVDLMLAEGKLEIPEGSKYYIKCEKCGCALKFGTICPECAKAMTAQLKEISQKTNVGEVPKYVAAGGKVEGSGKMRFVGEKK
jgi:hypothetical protein